jgi:hypothetical protein
MDFECKELARRAVRAPKTGDFGYELTKPASPGFGACLSRSLATSDRERATEF